MTATKNHGGRRARAGRRAGPPTRVVRLPVPLAEFARKLAAAGNWATLPAFSKSRAVRRNGCR